MRIPGTFLLGICLALLPSVGAQTAAAPGGPQVGDTYDDVVAKLGAPTSEMSAGSTRILFFPSAKIKLRNGMVSEIDPVAGASAAPAPPPAPAATPASPPPAPEAEAAGAPGGAAASPIRTRTDAVENEVAAFEFTVLGDFRKEAFDELERQAAGLIKDRARFGDGSWKIVCFHQALSVPDSAAAGDWQVQEQRIGRWENAFPNSVTAKIAHVEFMTTYAWRARGGLVAAAQVKPEAMDLFRTRMAQAQALLQTAVGLEPKSPMLWYAGLQVALGQHWSMNDTANFYIQGKQFEPEFWYLDTSLAYYLLPRWNGKPGEWEGFAAQESQRPGGIGSEGYARVAYSMRGFYRNIFKETQVQWPEVKDGFQTLFRKYPASMQLVNEYAYLASNAGDRDAARWAFDKMGDYVDPYIWNNKALTLFRTWAYRQQ